LFGKGAHTFGLDELGGFFGRKSEGDSFLTLADGARLFADRVRERRGDGGGEFSKRDEFTDDESTDPTGEGIVIASAIAVSGRGLQVGEGERGSVIVVGGHFFTFAFLAFGARLLLDC
jgi:hypothetical protein